MRNRALSMIGIAAKSGKLVSGEFATEKAVKTMNAYLVIVAEDASDNTKKMFSDMTDYYETPILFFGTKEELGKHTGKELRASLAVTDEHLADAVAKKIKANFDADSKNGIMEEKL